MKTTWYTNVSSSSSYGWVFESTLIEPSSSDSSSTTEFSLSTTIDGLTLNALVTPDFGSSYFVDVNSSQSLAAELASVLDSIYRTYYPLVFRLPFSLDDWNSNTTVNFPTKGFSMGYCDLVGAWAVAIDAYVTSLLQQTPSLFPATGVSIMLSGSFLSDGQTLQSAEQDLVSAWTGILEQIYPNLSICCLFCELWDAPTTGKETSLSTVPLKSDWQEWNSVYQSVIDNVFVSSMDVSEKGNADNGLLVVFKGLNGGLTYASIDTMMDAFQQLLQVFLKKECPNLGYCFGMEAYQTAICCGQNEATSFCNGSSSSVSDATLPDSGLDCSDAGSPNNPLSVPPSATTINNATWTAYTSKLQKNVAPVMLVGYGTYDESTSFIQACQSYAMTYGISAVGGPIQLAQRVSLSQLSVVNDCSSTDFFSPSNYGKPVAAFLLQRALEYYNQFPFQALPQNIIYSTPYSLSGDDGPKTTPSSGTVEDSPTEADENPDSDDEIPSPPPVTTTVTPSPTTPSSSSTASNFFPNDHKKANVVDPIIVACVLTLVIIFAYLNYFEERSKDSLWEWFVCIVAIIVGLEPWTATKTKPTGYSFCNFLYIVFAYYLFQKYSQENGEWLKHMIQTLFSPKASPEKQISILDRVKTDDSIFLIGLAVSIVAFEFVLVLTPLLPKAGSLLHKNFSLLMFFFPRLALLFVLPFLSRGPSWGSLLLWIVLVVTLILQIKYFCGLGILNVIFTVVFALLGLGLFWVHWSRPLHRSTKQDILTVLYAMTGVILLFILSFLKDTTTGLPPPRGTRSLLYGFIALLGVSGLCVILFFIFKRIPQRFSPTSLNILGVVLMSCYLVFWIMHAYLQIRFFTNTKIKKGLVNSLYGLLSLIVVVWFFSVTLVIGYPIDTKALYYCRQYVLLALLVVYTSLWGHNKVGIDSKANWICNLIFFQIVIPIFLGQKAAEYFETVNHKPALPELPVAVSVPPKSQGATSTQADVVPEKKVSLSEAQHPEKQNSSKLLECITAMVIYCIMPLCVQIGYLVN